MTPRQLTSLLVVSALFLACACRPQRPAVESAVQALADRIGADAQALAARLETTGGKLETLLANPQSAPADPFPSRTFEVFGERLRFFSGGKGEGFAFHTGAVAFDAAQKSRLLSLQNLEPDLRAALESDPTAVLAWLSIGPAIALGYPAIDVVAYIPEGMNLRENLHQNQLGGPEKNPSRSAFWEEPYPDMAGNGYITSLVRPVYAKGVWEGVVAFDLSLRKIQERHFSGRDDLLLLLSPGGFAAAGTPAAMAALGLKPLLRYPYLDQIEKRNFSAKDFLVQEHPDREVRRLAASPDTLRDQNTLHLGNGRSFRVFVRTVPGLGWRLVGLEAL